MFRRLRYKYILLIIFVLTFNSTLHCEDWKKLLTLDGNWKFNIGDDTSWAAYDFNDFGWDEIYVPSAWEDEGYNDYNGYAWYRKSFRIKDDVTSKSLYLSLGFIDDVDEVYLNGVLIGKSGSFPPEYKTAYNAYRNYFIPIALLKNDGDNIIAVRVYDERLAGGIVYGDISISYMETFELLINLEGYWKFKTGDSLDYKYFDFPDNDWDKMMVPSKWESNGYPNYNGFGWYRKKIFISDKLKNKKLVLILGKIDDIDECYVNGKRIGRTGDFVVTPKFNDFDNEWQEFRGYYIPDGLLKFNEENIIAIRVYDGYLDGGIYEGPIGITTQQIYREYWKSKKNKKSIWELLFD